MSDDCGSAVVSEDYGARTCFADAAADVLGSGDSGVDFSFVVAEAVVPWTVILVSSNAYSYVLVVYRWAASCCEVLRSAREALDDGAGSFEGPCFGAGTMLTCEWVVESGGVSMSEVCGGGGIAACAESLPEEGDGRVDEGVVGG